MNRKNFFLISLSVPVLILPITSIACKSDQIYASTDISNINKEFFQYQNQIHELVSINNEKGNVIRQFIQKNPIIQITAAGKINDNSFNQMTWEAISEFARNVGFNLDICSYKETKSMSINEIHQAYSDALNKQYKIWVLTGWQHQNFFQKWIQNPLHQQKFKEANIKIISIDWDASQINELEPGTCIALNFRTQESSFLIGYAISQFLNEKYPNLSKGIYKKGGEGVNGVYNQDNSKYTILIEIGGVDSTTAEVLNSTLAFTECFMEVISENEG